MVTKLKVCRCLGKRGLLTKEAKRCVNHLSLFTLHLFSIHLIVMISYNYINHWCGLKVLGIDLLIHITYWPIWLAQCTKLLNAVIIIADICDNYFYPSKLIAQISCFIKKCYFSSRYTERFLRDHLVNYLLLRLCTTDLSKFKSRHKKRLEVRYVLNSLLAKKQFNILSNT